MAKNTDSDTNRSTAGKQVADFLRMAQRILRCTIGESARVEFLEEITGLLLGFSECDAVELRLRLEDSCLRCEASSDVDQPLVIETAFRRNPSLNPLLGHGWNSDRVEDICRMVIENHHPASLSNFSRGGSFWTGDLDQDLPGSRTKEGAVESESSSTVMMYASLVAIPLIGANETIGLVMLKSRERHCFNAQEIELYENVIQTAGLAVVNQLAQASLRERIKELTCLYSLAQLAEYPNIQLEDLLQGIVELLPAAWQYPAITAARITLHGRSYTTANHREEGQRQSAEIFIHGKSRGRIEVVYTEAKPDLDEGPFLREERSLIDAVARQITLIAERRLAAEERTNLQDQLRHADRLATIGQLSAGVAHELNEPLGNILAFAQLAQKCPELSPQVVRDIEKIVVTSLHAREIVKKLMLFARQMPPQTTQVNLNVTIEEGLYFLESRCAKSGVVLERRFAPCLPTITADPSQLHQVLVNLVVNAIQAMPTGGTLKIVTSVDDRHVILTVEDDGMGMSQDILEQIFLPFFTTKDVNEGTGLGLAVVHGIVVSHGGRIDVESTPGKGTRFELRFPVAVQKDQKEPSCHDLG